MKKNIILAVVLVLVVGSIVYLEHGKVSPPPAGGAPSVSITPQDVAQSASSTPEASATTTLDTGPKIAVAPQTASAQYPRAKEIVDPSGFVNTAPFKLADVVGRKVILVDFWTYSCINCLRTLPYVTSWYAKYKDAGLLVVGIHTPEFDFEKNIDNVKMAVAKYGITYPVVLDNNYGTWQNYGNQYWPREYLIDIHGNIVHDQIGEGNYDETEKAIQAALEERKKALGSSLTVPGGLVNPSVSSSISTGSPETYFGAARNEFLANGTQATTGDQTLTIPADIEANNLYLGGGWHFQDQFAVPQAGAKIVYKYRSKGVYIVASGGNGVVAHILRDGKPLGAEAGADVTTVNGASTVNFKESRLYRLIDDPAGAGEHTLEIDFDAPGAQVFTFTFG